MKKLLIEGPARLSGTVRIHGAKNSVLPVLAACCLCASPCVLHNCPDIEDVRTALKILETLGCKTKREGSTLLVDPAGLDSYRVSKQLAGKMRSSVLFLGPLLAKFSRAELALPGGCPLGDRPIDLHVKALSLLGARFSFQDGAICAEWPKRLGGAISLPIPSVGATENLLLACAMGKTEVTLTGAAREPEISDLIGFLRAAGADISGAGTGELVIRGVPKLHGATYTILPDRIEAATYLCMAAGCGGEVELKRADGRCLQPVLDFLRTAGCEISCAGSQIFIRSSGDLTAIERVVTAPYPGFPTDAQPVLMAAVLKAKGESVFHETVFARRFLHVPELWRLGADITLRGQTAAVRGVSKLHGAELKAEDLRGAAALVAAELMAEGKSELTGLGHLERGYCALEENLKNLGAAIKSVDIPAPFVYNT